MNGEIGNFRAVAGNNAVTFFWDEEDGADGYIIYIYYDKECKRLYRKRYAEGNRKGLLGYKNGTEFFAKMCSFKRTDGKEVILKQSPLISFIPVSKKLIFNRNVLVMKKGDTYKLGWEINNTVPDVKLSSSDIGAAKVLADGTVTAVSEGYAEISAEMVSAPENKAIIPVYVDRGPALSTNTAVDLSPVYTADENGVFGKTYVRSLKASVFLAGDIMCMPALQRECKQNGGYDFTRCFTEVRETLKGNDLNIAVLETCISHSYPYESEEQRRENGVPNCNSPAALLSAVKYAGFHGLVTANNHCCDTLKDGLTETTEQVKAHGMCCIGTFESPEDKRFTMFDVNGINIAVLAYTQISNGIPDDLKTEDSIYMINPYLVDAVRNDAENARKAGADYIIVYIHWGTMNSSAVTSLQERTAKEIADAGADLIAGSHPHVPQKYDTVVSSDGRKVPCIYSMGNFFTNMREMKANRESVSLRVILEKKNGSVGADVSLVHGITEGDGGNIRTVLRKNETDERTEKTMNGTHNENIRALTVGSIAEILNGKPNFPIETVINENVLSITWKNYKAPSSVYFMRSVNGNENEGLSHISELAENALAVVTEKEIAGCRCIIVRDIDRAFRETAAFIRKKLPVKVVEVTGSVGKTTTCNMIASVLKETFRTECTGNKGNVPLAVAENILKIGNGTKYYVMETASSQPGQIHKSSLICQPDACVITIIGTSHIDLLGSRQNICDTKLQILDGAAEGAPLFLNADDDYLSKVKSDHPIIYFSINSDSDYKAENIIISRSVIDFDVVYKGGKVHIVLNAFGRHNIYDALAAFAVGKWAGMDDAAIMRGISKFKTDGIRQNIYTAYKNNTIINDCFGASPEANIVMFDMLRDIKAEEGQRKIAVLGHISRMGRFAEEIHRDIGKKLAAGYDFDLVVTFGGKSRIFSEEYEKAGKNARHFYDDNELVAFMKEYIRKGDIILFKGVQKSYYFDDMVKKILDAEYKPLPVIYYGKDRNVPRLHVTSPSMVLMDASDRTVICGKNMHVKRNPAALASICAIMTLLENGIKPYDIITVVSEVFRYTKGCPNYGMKQGEQYYAGDLIWLVLKKSYADALYALAIDFSGSLKDFMKLYDETLYTSGAENTSCIGPLGKRGDVYSSTAYDIALLTSYALKNDIFRGLISRDSITVKELTQNQRKEVIVSNKLNTQDINDDHNLYSPNIMLVKSGNNADAGKCLTAAVKKNGKYYISVIMGTVETEYSLLLYNETRCLLDHAAGNADGYSDMEVKS